MFRQEFVLISILVVSLTCKVQAAQISVNWDGGGDGYSWGDMDNWNPNIVPHNTGPNTFAVTIDSGSSGVDVILNSSYMIDQLDCYGEETRLFGRSLEPVTLTFSEANSLTNYGYLRFEIDIIGDVTNTNGAELYLHDDKNIFGNLYNHAGGIIEVTNADRDIEDGNVVNAGTIYATDGGALDSDVYFLNSGRIELMSGGVGAGIFDNNNTSVVEGSGTIWSEQLIDNKGYIYASHGALLLISEGTVENSGTLGNLVGATLHVTASGGDPNNQGTIKVNANGSVVFDSNLVNDSNGVIELFGGILSATTITQKADANFMGFGGITGDVMIDPNGLIKLTGPTNIIGDITVSVGATLQISDGQTLITGQTTCDGTIHLMGGTVIFQGGCDCDGCNIINEAGIDRNHFDINTDGIENFTDFAEFAENWLWQASWY